MFPGDYIQTANGPITKADLEQYPYIDIICKTFCRSIVQQVDRVRYFPNGDMQRDCIYSALPYDNIDGISPVSVYGALMLKNE